MLRTLKYLMVGLLILPTIAHAASVSVAIKDYKFQPSQVTIHPGDQIIWTNADTAAHTVSAQSGDFSSGGLASGATFSHVFPKGGTFAYHCALHPMMHGTIVVIADKTKN